MRISFDPSKSISTTQIHNGMSNLLLCGKTIGSFNPFCVTFLECLNQIVMNGLKKDIKN